MLIFLVLTSCTDNNQKAEQTLTNITTDTIFTEIIEDSICKVDEIINDKYNHLNELLNSLNKSNPTFNNIITTFNNHITDTITKFKFRNEIVLELGKEYGLTIYFKELIKVKNNEFDKLKIDSFDLFKYYQDVPIIADEEIEEKEKEL